MVVVLLLLLRALHLSIFLVLCEQVFVGYVEVLCEGFFWLLLLHQRRKSQPVSVSSSGAEGGVGSCFPNSQKSHL